MKRQNAKEFLSDFEQDESIDKRYAQRLQQELEAHIEDSVDDAQLQGIPAERAEQEAIHKIGDSKNIITTLHQALSYHPGVLYSENIIFGLIIGMIFFAAYYVTLLPLTPFRIVQYGALALSLVILYAVILYRMQQLGLSQRFRRINILLLHVVTTMHAIALLFTTSNRYLLYTVFSVGGILFALAIAWMVARRVLFLAEQYVLTHEDNAIIRFFQRFRRPIVLTVIIFGIIDVLQRILLPYSTVDEYPWYALPLQFRFELGVNPTILGGLFTSISPATITVLVMSMGVFALLSMVFAVIYYIVYHRQNPLVRFPWIRLIFVVSIIHAMFFRLWPAAEFEWGIPTEWVQEQYSESYAGWAVELWNYWNKGETPGIQNLDEYGITCEQVFANGVKEDGYCSTVRYSQTVLFSQDQPVHRITALETTDDELTIRLHRRYTRNFIEYTIDKSALNN